MLTIPMERHRNAGSCFQLNDSSFAPPIDWFVASKPTENPAAGGKKIEFFLLGGVL